MKKHRCLHTFFPVKHSQSAIYALPTLATYFLVSPIAILQGIYAKHFGLSLASISTVILVARLFDAVSDPVIGYFSDRYRARTGTRKPFMAVGGVLLVISSYFLYVPQGEVSAVYFLICFIFFYLSWTLFEVPHMAWAGEIVTHSQGKTEIYTLRNLCGFLGALLFFIVPFLPVFETREVTPKTLQWSVLVIGFLMFPFLYLCLRRVPDGHKFELKKRDTPKELFVSIVRNRPLLIFLMVYLFWGLGVGMWLSMLFIFVDSYLNFGNQLAFSYLIALSAGMVSSLLWHRLATWLGKKQAWAIGMVLILVAVVGTGLLQPGDHSFVFLLLLMVAGHSGFSATGVLAPSLLADIVDYGTWKFGVDRAGVYFSFYTLMMKITLGVGAGLALMTAGIYGFDVSAAQHSEASIWGMRLGLAYIPALFIAVAFFFLLFVPINARRHNIVRRRLQSRVNRALPAGPP